VTWRCIDANVIFSPAESVPLVQNGFVLLRSLRLTPLTTVAGSALLALVLWGLAPMLVGREFHLRELLLVAAVVVPLLEWRRRRALKREREQIESLRDSALW
jgi:hypothetical protein